MNEPADCIDTPTRSEAELSVYRLLDKLSIPYFRVDHEETPNMEACRAIDCKLGVSMCKNLFLCNRQKTSFYLLLLAGEKPFRTKEISAELGVSRLSFADAEDMKALLGVSPGSVTVLALKNDPENKVRLLIDRDLLSMEFIGCHPCVNTSSLRIATSDILSVFLPFVHHDYTEVTVSAVPGNQ